MTNKLPFLYCKARVAFLDDDQFFLDSIGDFFENKMNIFSSTNPTTFIEVVNGASIHKDLTTLIKQKENITFDESVISIDLLKMSQSMFGVVNSKRPFGCAFIDYNMPSIDGISVSKKINGYTSICLLTGEMNEVDAIDAFNQTIIGGYVKKQDPDILGKIVKLCDEMNDRFLKKINKDLSGFFLHNHAIKEIYNNKDFFEYVNNLIRKEKIVFTCIYEIFGSMVLSSCGKLFLLNVYPLEEINDLILPLIDEEHPLFDEISKNEVIVDYKRWDDSRIQANSISKDVRSDFVKFDGDYPFFVVLREI